MHTRGSGALLVITTVGTELSPAQACNCPPELWRNGCSSAMVDTFGLPTIFFTHSAANLQWPELAQLICPENVDSSLSHSKALQENQLLLTGSSFHHRIHKFVDASMSAFLMPLKPFFFLTLRLGVWFCGFRSRDHVALRLSPW